MSVGCRVDLRFVGAGLCTAASACGLCAKVCVYATCACVVCSKVRESLFVCSKCEMILSR